MAALSATPDPGNVTGVMMEIDILRAELERLFELDELFRLSRDLLGFDPEEVGGTAAKASFAGALTTHCVERDAVEALCDALLAVKPQADPKVFQIRISGLVFDEELKAGENVGDWVVVRKLGEGRLGVSYLAKHNGADFRLKVLRREATRDRRGLHRFLTVSRLVGTIDHPGLPKQLTAGQIGDRQLVAHAYVDGQPLAARVARTGPMHLNEARGLVKTILEALAALHERQLSHGDLRLENVIVIRRPDGDQDVVLLDAGSDRLRARTRAHNGGHELFSIVGSPRTVAPEQIRGYASDPRSDVYSFGALLYEVLTGKPVFSTENAIETAIGHLTQPPKRPSEAAPRGWVSKEIDDLVVRLLLKDPSARPRDARAVLEALEHVERGATARREAPIGDDEIDRRVETLVAEPLSEEAAVQLEAAVDEGADATRVADAMGMAADQIEVGDSAERREAQKRLLFRAARLYEGAARDPAKAEHVYARLVELDASDEIAVTALEDVRRQLGKFEELIEMLLGRRERADSGPERARAMAEIGRIYARDLDDAEQALVAFTQAFCEDPEHGQYADELDDLTAKKADAWAEILSSCAEAADSEEMAVESKNALLLRMGRWYEAKLGRADLALPCFQNVIATDAANDAALEGMTHIYRKAQQWAELGMVLLRRADAAARPAKARDLKADAAEILEQQLGDTPGARDLYEQILTEDPGHEKAVDALARIYERTGDQAGYAKILERRAETLRGDEKLNFLSRVAEIYEAHLKNDQEAIRRYDVVLFEDPNHLDALRGLDRLFSRTGRYQELLSNLRKQIELAATPRQKIVLYERIAGVYDEEFLDHEKAASAWEAVLQVDPAHEGAITALIRHCRALDRWEDVAALYERHLKLTGDPEQRLELALARGRVLAEQIGSPERAMAAYEMVLQIKSEHAGALEALAKLRETAGDADAALQAIEALAAKASSAEAKAEQFVRAAKLLDARGDRDGAIERYKRALDANPKDAGAAMALRQAFAARGDVNAAIQLLEREIEQTEGDRAKASLCGEIAMLARDRLKDDKRAKEAAERTLTFDPTNLDALLVLGDLAFESNRHLEAAKHYELISDRADSLPKPTAVRVLVRYVDALAKTASTEKALVPVDTLLRIAPDDSEALARVAQLTFAHGSPRRAAELYEDLLKRFDTTLHGRERAVALYRYGEALRRSDRPEPALVPLEEASDLDPSSELPLVALGLAYEKLEAWDKVIKAKTRHLDVASGEERVTLLIEVGDIASTKLNDRTQAAKSYVAALEERPDDRRLLSKLMQLYSEEKDWNKLVEVVLRLAEFVDEPKQKIKYLHTAAIVTGKQMGDVDRALEFYEQVLEFDPEFEKAAVEAIDLERERSNYEGVEKWLKRRLAILSKSNDQQHMLEAFSQLGDLYEKQLGWMDQAVDAFEAAQTLDPDNRERAEHLSELYASDPQKYLDKAVASQALILRQNPYRPESYKMLRRLYTEVKNADAAWCLCQALYVLNLAEPDEERFFKRMRADTAAPAQEALTDEDWLQRVMHADAEPLLTSLFALIEPSVIAKRGQSLIELGYDPRYAIDLAMHPYPMSQTLHYASGVLGMDPPSTFQNSNDTGGLSFLHAHQPSIVLGLAALNTDVPPQAAAFIAARHLAYFRPGMYVRHLVASSTGLKSWLFAAIKLIVPQFPVAAELEGPVIDAIKALDAGLTGQVKDHLTRVVSKLLQSGGALDLKRWVAGVDLTADRAGFVVAHDLETAVEIIKASDETSSAVPNQERLKELVLYAVSEPYFGLRRKLGITIDS
jgi:tetratricopeptide (TPR) repeat protein